VRRNRTVLGTGVAIVLLVVVAVRGDRSATKPVETASTPPATPAPNRRGNGQAVTMAFGGDVHFEGKIRVRLGADPSSILAGVAPVLEAADLAVVNLETAITGRGTRAPGKQYVFRAPASAFAALKAGGVDVATMANNHGLDYGGQGLEDTLDAAAADDGLPLVGIGRSADEAYRPFLTVVKGQRIAVLGATQVLDTNLVTAWTATDSRPGLASAKDFGRLARAGRTPSSSTSTGASRVRPAPTRTRPSWPRAWSTPGPTWSSDRTPTACRGAAAWGVPSWPTAWATSPSTPTRGRRPRPASSPSRSRAGRSTGSSGCRADWWARCLSS